MKRTLAVIALATLGFTSQVASAQPQPCTGCYAEIIERLDRIVTATSDRQLKDDVEEIRSLLARRARYPGSAIDIRDISLRVTRRVARQVVADRYCNHIGFGAGLIAESEAPQGNEFLTRLICYNPADPPA